MTKGFFVQGRNDGYEFMERIALNNGLIVNGHQYLHGCCDDFARLLADKYEYKIVYAIDKDEEGYYYLLHAFAKVEHMGVTYYIDVRGTTTDLATILEEFDWSEELFYMEFNDSSEALRYSETSLSFTAIEDCEDIELLVRYYEEYYNIRLIQN